MYSVPSGCPFPHHFAQNWEQKLGEHEELAGHWCRRGSGSRGIGAGALAGGKG